MPPTSVRKANAAARTQAEEAETSDLRRYIYCIIDCADVKPFDCTAIGDGSDGVLTVAHNGVAALVSPSAREKYAIDRRNTLAHQRVMEHVMGQGHTVLPVKFDTIAEAKNGAGPEERIVQQVLVKRFDELSSLLGAMTTRVEMGVKALWKDLNVVFREIVGASEEIKRLRNKIVRRAGQGGKAGPSGAQFATRARLGEMVKDALGATKEREQKALLNAIRDIVVDVRTNKTFGDKMFANLALLLEKTQVEELDRRLNELPDVVGGRSTLKYVGPVPPSNFIELVITWDE